MIIRNIIDTKAIRNIVTVKPGDTVARAAEILSEHRIGALVVSENGETIDGILSERDIVKTLGKIGASCMEQNVATLMTADVQSCAPEDTAMSVMERMSRGRFRHMPVLVDSKIVGVVSIGDVVQARISEIQAENSALTGMIANNW